MASTDLDEFSVYVGNLDFRVPVADLEELVYELFLQVSRFLFVSGGLEDHF